MSDEELIAEAKKRYPIGTKVDSLGGNMGQVIKNEYDQCYWDGNHFRINKDCSIYRKDINSWAKIVQAVEPVIINNYPIY